MNEGEFKESKRLWVEQFERKYMNKKLTANYWSIAATAKEMNVDVATVWRKIKKYGLQKMD